MTSPQGTKICLGYNSGEKGGEGDGGNGGGVTRAGDPFLLNAFLSYGRFHFPLSILSQTPLNRT